MKLDGKKLTELMEELDFTEEQLAEEIEMSQPFISMLKKDMRNAKDKTIQHIADVLDVNIDEITR